MGKGGKETRGKVVCKRLSKLESKILLKLLWKRKGNLSGGARKRATCVDSDQKGVPAMEETSPLGRGQRESSWKLLWKRLWKPLWKLLLKLLWKLWWKLSGGARMNPTSAGPDQTRVSAKE